MENPFRYGGVVRRAYFADREEELRILEREMGSCGRVFLVSPRRFGKTCLLFNLMDRLDDREFATAYIDLSAHPDVASFAGALTLQTSRALESNTERLIKLISGFQRLRPKIDVGPDGSISVGIEASAGESEPLKALLEGLSHAEDLATRKKRKLIIIIDEFSDLSKYNGVTIEKVLRSEIQRHEHVGYVLSGSEQSVMLSMVQERDRPLFKLGRLMALGPIPRNQYKTFIAGWLQKGGFQYPSGGIERILTLGNDVPHDIQRLCHIMWELASVDQEITPALIELLPKEIVRQDSPFYEMLWQTATQTQKALLIAVAKDPGLSPLSKEFMLKHRMSPPSSIRASLQSLVKKGILYRDIEGRYHFSDQLMSFWIVHSLQERNM